MTDYSTFQMIVDLPSATPGLGFNDTARALADLMMQSEPQFAVAVYGPWGSGKTTLMRAIKRELDAQPGPVITVDFSAWRYEKEETLIVPLLDAIRESLMAVPSNPQFSDPHRQSIARKTASTVGRVMASMLAGLSFKVGIPNALDLTFDASKALARGDVMAAGSASTFADRFDSPELPQSPYHAAFLALTGAFEEFEVQTGGRIIIFIDDLDRCLPEGMLEEWKPAAHLRKK